MDLSYKTVVNYVKICFQGRHRLRPVIIRNWMPRLLRLSRGTSSIQLPVTGTDIGTALWMMWIFHW